MVACGIVRLVEAIVVDDAELSVDVVESVLPDRVANGFFVVVVVAAAVAVVVVDSLSLSLYLCK